MWDWLGKSQQLRDMHVPFVLVTITARRGSSPRDVGAKMIVTASREAFGTIGGGHLEQQVIEDASACLLEALSQSKPYPLCFRTGQCCGGAVEVFMEVFGVGPELYLFGAGHVGQAVCRVFEGTPFLVHLIDSRKEWIRHPDLPSGIVRHESEWRDFVAKAGWHKSRTFVAVMTHDHGLDEEIIADVIQRPSRYIGLIGSQTKWQRFQQLLRKRGLSADAINRVQCPLGEDTGGKAPQEVAISLAAQLLKILYEKQ